jgi:hypothetical protein
MGYSKIILPIIGMLSPYGRKISNTITLAFIARKGMLRPQ